MSALTLCVILFILDVSNGQNRNSCSDYSRREWNALKAKGILKNLKPVSDIFIHHTNDGGSCLTPENCFNRVKSLQSKHEYEKKWQDIAWNFLIGGDGKIYEGVGGKKQGFHTLKWNSKSLGIAFIGNYDNNAPENMLQALNRLIDCGRAQGFIKSDYKVHAHRDLRGSTTRCPGNALYNQLKTRRDYRAGPI